MMGVAQSEGGGGKTTTGDLTSLLEFTPIFNKTKGVKLGGFPQSATNFNNSNNQR